MFNIRYERIATGVGNLFFLAAIVFFITLILLASGAVEAQEFPFSDALEPDVLEEDALGPNALEEDALGLKSFDPELFREWAQMDVELPVVTEIPPCPREAIHHYFCWRCWKWYRGISRVPLCPWHRPHYHLEPPPAVPGVRAPGGHQVALKQEAQEGEKK